jgi:mannose-6-phosphate isomerase
MSDIYRLHNQIKHYEWGSREIIPRFLGAENADGLPWAEMWMGTHSLAPSRAERKSGGLANLAELSGELPFLFKLIAVEKPLSIQAHPNRHQAAEGFSREEKAGVALDAPERNYKDHNHKPEILCAISPFFMMAGFRQPSAVYKSVEEFLFEARPLKESLSPLLRALEDGSLADFFRALCGLSKQERENVCSFLRENGGSETGGGNVSARMWKLMRGFSAQYPDDCGVLSPLYLNLLSLEAGQAVYIPCGTLHSYISGFGAELMASSDNVLRGGLTPKHIDTGELFKILDFSPFMPQALSPSSSRRFRYPAACEELSLSLLKGGGENEFGESGPAVCIVTGGELCACGETFKKGESFFVPPGSAENPLVFSGDYSLFAAGGRA